LTPPQCRLNTASRTLSKIVRSELSMKNKEQDLAGRGTDNTKHQQEATASRDFEKQRNAGVKEAEAQAKKSKKSDKGANSQDG
jgi:hypothetical protein